MFRRTSVVITITRAAGLIELSPVSNPTASGPWISARSRYFWLDNALIGAV